MGLPPRSQFEARGFRGSSDIDNFTVELDPAHHDAIHAGSRMPGGEEWNYNSVFQGRLNRLETKVGRQATAREVWDIGRYMMWRYQIPKNFERWRGA